MIFIIGELAVSWLLLWMYERSHLTALGVAPTTGRSADFAFGLLSASIVAAVGHYLVVLFSGSQLSLNPGYTAGSLLTAAGWILRSVLTEELLFRGALIYIAIKILGIHKACALSSIAFGVYHWFSYGVLGDPASMLYVFILTGLAGLMFAYSFAFTRSLYLPLGLHLGWNLASTLVFSQGPLGDQLLLIEIGERLGPAGSIANFVYQVSVLPILIYFYLTRRGNKLQHG